MVLRASKSRLPAAKHIVPPRSSSSSPSTLWTPTSALKAEPSSRRGPSRPSCSRRFTTSIPVLHPRPSAANATSASSSLSASELPIEHTDVAILGGGVVGLALAASLASSQRSSGSNGDSPLRIVLLEASDLNRLREWAAKAGPQQSSAQGHDGIQWENRVVSLTMENWTWLESMGITEYIVQERIKPITAMHVTDGLSGATLDLGEAVGGAASSSSSSSQQQLSNMVELSNLQQALLRYIDEKASQGAVQVEIWDKTKVEDVAPDMGSAAEGAYIDAWPLMSLSSSSQQRQLRPRLLVGADGPSSPVRKYAGIAKSGWPYDRRGLVGTLRFDESESQQRGHTIAYQRFLPSGTIAWLPLSTSSASMVWTLPPEIAQALTEMHKATSASSDGHSSRSVLADLVTAAWRLPWSSLSRLFSLITSSGPSLNPQLLRSEIAAHLAEAAQSGRAVPEDECPPPIDVDIDARSVASFPLQVAHAEAYLGSSLLAKQATSSPVVPDVASLVRDVGAWTTRLAASFGATQPAATEALSPTPRARTVLIGDAAHSVHPLAGQGLNLGVADVRSLTSVLHSALQVGEDVGSHEALRPYEEERWWRNAAMLLAVDRLHFIYGAPVPKRLLGGSVGEAEGRPAVLDAFYEAKVWARSTGVEVLNELDLVKGVMQRFAGSKGNGASMPGKAATTTKPWPTSKVRTSGVDPQARSPADAAR
ncbi:FAD/NAD(P)-binding domain-containing protein [Jaminaea rosea]|uniref:FAD/NAD(P)-binding domain-containing protein n=1 Tax=Jaminaea rosea TaxID=1569628 RepID=A0A316UWE7_9BASI|nr:FAD/NAD(P)-binding domain-containing protein [Jaminaea rosea]PWN29552.1 FAD/NAD(P)-binding domain-containing protein [Jaminaea rosea]